MKKSLVAGVLFFNGLAILAQSNDEQVIKDIYKSGLTNAKCYSWLDHLSNKIGARLSGSDNAEKAVQYTKAQLETLGLDKVYLQEMMVPKWVRGQKETAYILDNKTKMIDVINYLEQKGFHKFSYLTANGTEIITDFSDHYQYCNIVCVNKSCILPLF